VQEIPQPNLEAQTFADGVFELVITQDVFERVMRPDRAIKEIARTLKPNGATLMTVPIVNRTRPSIRRARMEKGEITHLLEAQYHGNPIGGSSQEVLDLAKSTGDADLLIVGHVMGACCHWTGEFTEALEHADKVLDLYDEWRHCHLADIINLGDPKTFAVTHASRTHTHAGAIAPSASDGR
jgi:SAM-dependent methyltransferase